MLASPSAGGADLTAFGASLTFFRHPDFVEMTTPTLVVMGENDVSPHLTTRGADWHADPYRLSTGPKCLLTITGGEHLPGGVSGHDARETTDENPGKSSYRPTAHLGVSAQRAVPGRFRLVCGMHCLG